MTTLAEYQKLALQTAMPEAFLPSYLVPSIVGEVGELFGKRGKAVRDHWEPERLDRELAAEYGDVLWMTAILLHSLDVDEIHLPNNTRDHRDPWYDLLDISQWLYEEHMQEVTPSLHKPACTLWQRLARNCQAITGHSMDEVMAINIEKLLSRQARGVLTGSGDNR